MLLAEHLKDSSECGQALIASAQGLCGRIFRSPKRLSECHGPWFAREREIERVEERAQGRTYPLCSESLKASRSRVRFERSQHLIVIAIVLTVEQMGTVPSSRNLVRNCRIYGLTR